METQNHIVNLPLPDYEQMQKAWQDAQLEFQVAKEEGLAQGLVEQRMLADKSKRELEYRNNYLSRVKSIIDIQLIDYRKVHFEFYPSDVEDEFRDMPKWWRFKAVKKWRIKHELKLKKISSLNDILYSMNENLEMLKHDYERKQFSE